MGVVNSCSPVHIDLAVCSAGLFASQRILETSDSSSHQEHEAS